MKKLEDVNIHSERIKLSSWLDNLYENKIIYHERVTILATLTEIVCSPEGFTAIVNKKQVLFMPHFLKRRKNALYHQIDNWDISSTWTGNIVDDTLQKIHVPYANFTIWSEPSFVKNIEKLLKNGKEKEVLKLIGR